jgi:hypothetical protein
MNKNISKKNCFKDGNWYYFDDATGDLVTAGSCIPDCYTAAIGSVASIPLDMCAGKLIVGRSMLIAAVLDRSFNVQPADGPEIYNY